MSFSQSFLDEIKDRNDIRDVVGRFVPLKHAGSNLVGLCPFHSEKTPSFTVFPATRSYYCFGCGEGGDAVTFVMRSEGLDYVGAIEYLAERAGIPMEDTGTYKSEAPKVRRERIIEVTTEAARFFRDRLNSPEGASAREYAEKRGYSQLTVKRFGIGFAPDGWNALTSALTAKGFTEDELTSAFLAFKSQKNGKLYDIFRNRLVFPIFDIQGEVIAFSARRLSDADDKKYINTSDTPAFKKSRVLFGMHIAKNTEDGTLLLCEGAPDAVALHQAGFSNTVATLGTAITPEHARLISRYAKTVFLCYDMDAAGTNAKLKAINLLGEAGITAQIVSLASDTKDPDEFIKKYGADAFRLKLKNSVGQVDFQLDQILAKYTIENPDEKLRAVGELTSFISSFDSRTVREVYANRIAQKLAVSYQPLSDEVERKHTATAKRAVKKLSEDDIRQHQGYGDKVNRDRIKYSAAAVIEEALLGMMLLMPELAKKAEAMLTPECFITAFNRRVFEVFRDDFAACREVMLSKDGIFTPEEISVIARYIANRRMPGCNTEKVLLDTISRLKEQRDRIDFDSKADENGVDELREYLNKKKKKTT